MNRPVRLVQLVHGYPPAIGGVEVSVRDLCEALVSEYGFEVTVLTTNALTVDNYWDARLPTIPIREDEVQNGVRIRRFPIVTRWVPLLQPAQAFAWRLRLPGNGTLRTWFHGPVCPAMLKALRQTPADVVCAAPFPLNHMRYPFLVGRTAPPVVLLGSVHTNQPWGYDRPNLLRLVNRARATVAHTEHERDWLIAHGAKPDKVRVIGHGIDPGELRPRRGAFRSTYGIDQNAFLVAYVGQQGANKGIDTLIAVLPELIAACPSAWLAVGGSRTPHSDELRRVAAKLPEQVFRRLVFADDLTAQAKADLLGDCDVFASPSKGESFGITTLEAWSLAKPTLVGDAPSQREIIEDNVTGIIVEHGNRDQLLKAIVRLAKNPELRRVLGRNGYERLNRDFRRSEIERRYADLLREAALTGSSGVPPRPQTR
jgi:glycosyltransferase involved in cell wall biosynthesis